MTLIAYKNLHRHQQSAKTKGNLKPIAALHQRNIKDTFRDNDSQRDRHMKGGLGNSGFCS
jgi:hypothetical protein